MSKLGWLELENPSLALALIKALSLFPLNCIQKTREIFPLKKQSLEETLIFNWFFSRKTFVPLCCSTNFLPVWINDSGPIFSRVFMICSSFYPWMQAYLEERSDQVFFSAAGIRKKLNQKLFYENKKVTRKTRCAIW